MTQKGRSPLCIWCKHLILERGIHISKCKAFSEEIPEEIWELEYDHREPHPDDNGIQFEKVTNYDDLMIPVRKGFTDDQLDFIYSQDIERLNEWRRAGFIKPPMDE